MLEMIHLFVRIWNSVQYFIHAIMCACAHACKRERETLPEIRNLSCVLCLLVELVGL